MKTNFGIRNTETVFMEGPCRAYTMTNKGTLKFLNFRTPEKFAVIYLKFKQTGQIIWF